MKTINIIGGGKVGKTLGRLWSLSQVFGVRCVLNRSLQSAAEAVDFIGGGRPIESYADLEPADLVMISTPDEAIEQCCRRLCAADVLRPGTIVFHCAGSLSSELLAPARSRGALVAGLHPVKSFADPATAVETFAGTFCAVEGDRPACETLEDAMHGCGAKCFHVEPDQKTIYHAATVIVCNYLVALMEAGLRCFEHSGMSRETAMEVMESIVTGTIGNLFELGPVGALTGPIARGERQVVQRQCEALGRWDEDIEAIYKSLGRLAVELSAAAGDADPEALAAIERSLNSD